MFDPFPSIFAILPPLESGAGRRTRYVSAGLSDAMEALLVCNSTSSGTISLLAASNADGDNSTVIWTNSFGGSGTEVQRVTIVPSTFYDVTRPYFAIEVGEGIDNTAAIITGTGRVIADDISSDVGVVVPPAWVEALRSPNGDLPILVAQMSEDPPRYWFNGAECTVEDIFTSNVNWANFNPATDIHAGLGLRASVIGDGCGPTLTAAPFAVLIVSGYTVVVKSTLAMIPSGNDNFELVEVDTWDDPDYANDRASALSGQANGTDAKFHFYYGEPETSDIYAAVTGTHNYAATLRNTGVVGSADGRSVVGYTRIDPVVPAPTNISIFVISNSGYTYMQSVYFYPPQPEADLPTLSAIGTPAWVEALRSPNGDLPILAAEMANTPPRYWLDGAECAIADIVEDAVNWTVWNALNVIAGTGYVSPSGSTGPVLSTAAFLAVGTQYTAVMGVAWDGVTTGTFSVLEQYHFPDFDTELGTALLFKYGSNPTKVDASIYCFTPDPSQELAIDSLLVADGAGVYRIAATVTNSRMAVSGNGETVQGQDILAPVVPTNAMVWAGRPSTIIKNIYLYPPQPEADLPALSTL